MPVATEKRYQNTTVRLPRQVYERAKTVAVRSQAASFNEFVVQAIEEKVQRLTEKEIDAAFAHMASDTDYQRSSIAVASAFEKSDWEAFQSGANSGTTHEQRHDQRHDKRTTRASKTRSR